MRVVRSLSASEKASTGFTNRGVPMMPSEMDPPFIGTLTIKDLLTSNSMISVLISRMASNTKKAIHSFLENENMADSISLFLGNLLGHFGSFKPRIRLYKFSIKEVLSTRESASFYLAVRLYYYSEQCR